MTTMHKVDDDDVLDAPHVQQVRTALADTGLNASSTVARQIADALGPDAVAQAAAFGADALARLCTAAHAQLADSFVKSLLPKSEVDRQKEWLLQRGIDISTMARASEKLKWMDVARREMAKAPAQNALATFKPPAPVMLSDVPEASRAAFQALPAEKRLSLSCTLHNPAITKEIRRLAALEAAAVNPRLTWTERNINERGAASARNSLRSRGVPI